MGGGKGKNTATTFLCTSVQGSVKGLSLPKIHGTLWCYSPRKSLVKGERLVRYEEKPEQLQPFSTRATKDPSGLGQQLHGAAH